MVSIEAVIRDRDGERFVVFLCGLRKSIHQLMVQISRLGLKFRQDIQVEQIRYLRRWPSGIDELSVPMVF